MMSKQQGAAFISIVRKWVEKSYSVEMSYDIKDDDATENYKFGFNNAVKSRKQVENAYNYYKEHHTAEQEGYLKKRISDFLSCLWYDRQIQKNFSEYCSIFQMKLVEELPKINLSNFQEDKSNPQYTVIEYVFNIIIDRYYPKALATERLEEYELSTGLSDETKRNHQLIALKAFEFTKSQGWNDSYAFYTDRQLESILVYVNENVPQKASVKKIQTLKKIMMEYQLNKLYSLEQLVEAAGEQGGPINDDNQKTKEILDELVLCVQNNSKNQKEIDKFAFQWAWKYFYGYSAEYERMREYTDNFCNMLYYEYSFFSNEYPIFKMDFVETLIEFIKEHKNFPTREQYMPLCWAKMYPDGKEVTSITNMANTVFSKMIKSELFRKEFGSTVKSDTHKIK